MERSDVGRHGRLILGGIDFEATGPFKVTSQDNMHPFQLAQYMTGCTLNGGTCPGDNGAACLGDEEYVNILRPRRG